MIDCLVRKLEQHKHLSREDQQVLLHAPWQVRSFGPRIDILREAERPVTVALLVEGFACRYKLLDNGKRQILCFHVAGDMIDLHAFLLEEMDHSVATLTPVRVAFLPHGKFAEIMDAHPRLARALWRDMAVETAVLREWLAGIGRRSAYGRISHLFCEVLVKLRAAGAANEQTCDLPLTQAELGDALGLSAVHVNRVLQQLRREGVITLKGATLNVKDWERLKEAGGFDAAYLHVPPATEPESLSPA
jgi:CRP-like cAMP-binding protein